MKNAQSIQQLYKDDETLRILHQQEAKIQDRIKKRKIRIAKAEHVVMEPATDPVCDEHDKKLEVSGVVDGSEIIIAWSMYDTDKQVFNTYSCSDCSDKVEAYDCPECGIVLGRYTVDAYKLKSKSLKKMGAKAGYFIRCSVCDSLIGFGATGPYGAVAIK